MLKSIWSIQKSFVDFDQHTVVIFHLWPLEGDGAPGFNCKVFKKAQCIFGNIRGKNIHNNICRFYLKAFTLLKIIYVPHDNDPWTYP